MELDPSPSDEDSTRVDDNRTLANKLGCMNDGEARPLLAVASNPTDNTIAAAKVIERMLGYKRVDVDTTARDGTRSAAKQPKKEGFRFQWIRCGQRGNQLTIIRDGVEHKANAFENYSFVSGEQPDAAAHQKQQRNNTLRMDKTLLDAMMSIREELRAREPSHERSNTDDALALAEDFICSICDLYDYAAERAGGAQGVDCVDCHFVNTENPFVHFSWHQDVHLGNIETSVGVQISDGQTAMDVAAQGQVKYLGRGSSVTFPSKAWHRSVKCAGGNSASDAGEMWKVVFFFRNAAENTAAKADAEAKAGVAAAEEEAVTAAAAASAGEAAKAQRVETEAAEAEAKAEAKAEEAAVTADGAEREREAEQAAATQAFLVMVDSFYGVQQARREGGGDLMEKIVLMLYYYFRDRIPDGQLSFDSFSKLVQKVVPVVNMQTDGGDNEQDCGMFTVINMKRIAQAATSPAGEEGHTLHTRALAASKSLDQYRWKGSAKLEDVPPARQFYYGHLCDNMKWGEKVDQKVWRKDGAPPYFLGKGPSPANADLLPTALLGTFDTGYADGSDESVPCVHNEQTCTNVIASSLSRIHEHALEDLTHVEGADKNEVRTTNLIDDECINVMNAAWLRRLRLARPSARLVVFNNWMLGCVEKLQLPRKGKKSTEAHANAPTAVYTDQVKPKLPQSAQALLDVDAILMPWNKGGNHWVAVALLNPRVLWERLQILGGVDAETEEERKRKRDDAKAALLRNGASSAGGRATRRKPQPRPPVEIVLSDDEDDAAPQRPGVGAQDTKAAPQQQAAAEEAKAEAVEAVEGMSNVAKDPAASVTSLRKWKVPEKMPLSQDGCCVLISRSTHEAHLLHTLNRYFENNPPQLDMGDKDARQAVLKELLENTHHAVFIVREESFCVVAIREDLGKAYVAKEIGKEAFGFVTCDATGNATLLHIRKRQRELEPALIAKLEDNARKLLASHVAPHLANCDYPRVFMSQEEEGGADAMVQSAPHEELSFPEVGEEEACFYAGRTYGDARMSAMEAGGQRDGSTQAHAGVEKKDEEGGGVIVDGVAPDAFASTSKRRHSPVDYAEHDDDHDDDHQISAAKLELGTYLSDKGLVMKDVPEDGDCQFHAIADQLNLLNVTRDRKLTGKLTGKLVRAAVSKSKWIQNFLDTQSNTTDANDIQALRNMHKRGVYGNHHTLMAACDHYNVQIRVIHMTYKDGIATNQCDHLIETDDDADGVLNTAQASSREEICIAHFVVGGYEHYVSTRPAQHADGDDHATDKKRKQDAAGDQQPRGSREKQRRRSPR